MTHAAGLPLSRILALWSPLALTWLMMAIEGPLLAAVIARLAEPKPNLAAYGVAFALALILEAPVIMILSAATALVGGPQSYRQLRNFTYSLNALMTAAMIALLATPLYDAVARGLVGLSPSVADRTHTALLLLLPWPGAIGYRRFFQGLLIRNGRTRLVAYGTLVRLGAMASTATVLFVNGNIGGASVGACALSAGVLAEALASRLMARTVVRTIRESGHPSSADGVGYARILSFYYPLALTSTISLAVHPLVTFFVGNAKAALESLAVLPVVHALTFVFRCAGLSYQEVAIALLARDERDLGPIARFATLLGVAASAGLTVIAFTPLATLWYRKIAGLGAELAAYAIPPTRILTPLPALAVLLALQRAVLVHGRKTGPISAATLLEIGCVALVLAVGIRRVGLVGVDAAAWALLAGRLASNAFLTLPCRRAHRRRGEPERTCP